MAYQLSINTGKPNTRTTRRQASTRNVASLWADDGNTRVEVELSPFGRIDITITRDDTHERRTLEIPPPRGDMKPNMPTIAVLQVGDDHASIVGPDHAGLVAHLTPEYTTGVS